MIPDTIKTKQTSKLISYSASSVTCCTYFQWSSVIYYPLGVSVRYHLCKTSSGNAVLFLPFHFGSCISLTRTSSARLNRSGWSRLPFRIFDLREDDSSLSLIMLLAMFFHRCPFSDVKHLLDWGCKSLVEHLSSMCEALASRPTMVESKQTFADLYAHHILCHASGLCIFVLLPNISF